MNRKFTYILLFFLSILGIVWIVNNLFLEGNTVISTNVCFIKITTGIPCVSCGTTRSVMEITKGNFIKALYYNPLGFIVFLGLSITPFWVLFDMIFRKSTLYNFLLFTGQQIQRKKILIILAIFFISNWIWNIAKGL